MQYTAWCAANNVVIRPEFPEPRTRCGRLSVSRVHSLGFYVLFEFCFAVSVSLSFGQTVSFGKRWIGAGFLCWSFGQAASHLRGRMVRVEFVYACSR